MKYGPFSEQDISRISLLLTEAGVPFEIDRSAAALSDWQRASLEPHPVARPQFNGLVAAAFVVVSDSVCLPDSVASFGLVASVDPLDEFVCPQCEFSGSATSLCPRHLTPLVSFAQKSRAEQIESNTLRNVVTCLLILAVVILLGVRGCFSF